MTDRTILLYRFMSGFTSGGIAHAMMTYADAVARDDRDGKTDSGEVMIALAKELETVARRLRKAVKEGDY